MIKLNEFWQELKRRKVNRIVTVYAAAAFVILELVSIIVDPLKLPERTLLFVIILLCAGFIVVVILSWIYDIHPDRGIVKTESADKVKEEDITKASNSWKIATYVSIVIIAGLIAFNIFSVKGGVKIDESLARSIAVLPFLNLSGDNEQDYISIGLTDEIIGHLYKVESFNEIRSLTSVYNFREPDRNMTEIAEELRVNYILEGSFKKMGTELKITAQLIDAKSDNHIWLRDYELPYSELLGIPGEIALQIAHQLNAFVSNEEEQQLERSSTTSREAFELYQMGRFYWNKRTREGFVQAIEYFEQAIEIDPNYSLAFAGLADTYLIMVYWDHMDMWEGRDMAEEMASKALELDKTLSEAYAVLGVIYAFIDWNWENGEKELQRALEINPNYSTAHQYYAEHLLNLGRLEEARMHINRAVELDPLSFVIRFVNSRIYYHQENFNEALQELRKCNEIQEGHPWIKYNLFYAYFQLGQEEKAYEALKMHLSNNPRYDLSIADSIFIESGMEGVLEWKIERNIPFAEVENQYYTLARDLALIEKYEDALEWLEKAFQHHHLPVHLIKSDIHFRGLHDNPRYRTVLKNMGLAE